jgi:hypothetical protein
MQRYRITLIADWRPDEPLALPLAPSRAARREDGHFELEFEVEGTSFDEAAGRLWGEAAACGLRIVGVEKAVGRRRAV